MKKILTIAIVMIVSLNVIKAQQGVSFGIKAGLNLENIIGLNSNQGVVGITENESSKMTFGFHAGVIVRVGFDDHWAFAPELLYTTGGARTTTSQTYTILGATYTSNTTGSLGLSYIQLPLFVNYKLDCGLYFEAGPYLAILVGTTKSTTDANNNSTTSSSDTANNSIDVGVGAGVGWRFCNGLGFNFRYNYGLNALYKNYTYDNSGISSTVPSYGKNGVLQFSISYMFGSNSCTPKEATHAVIITPDPIIVAAPVVVEKDIQFSVIAPNSVPAQHVVIETLPLSDYVFFNAGNTNIPDRYTSLSNAQATSFAEVQLQDCQKDPGTRSSRQLKVYYNVINIVGDRMRNHPNATIKLLGSSAGKGTDIALANANSVKSYLVTNFGIDGSRITVEGKNLPGNPSEIPGDTTNRNLTSDEDNRVHIVSTSPDLMVEVVGNSALCMKPIAVTAMDGNSNDDAPIVVNANGAGDALVSWSVDVTDSKGNSLNFGPFTSDRETISSVAILKDNQSDKYTIVLTGQTKTGKSMRKESTFNLVKETQPIVPEQSASILFQFDKSVTMATFKNFLTTTVAPLIPDNSTVVIGGHTDIIGSDDYNMNLSKERATAAQTILEDQTSKAGKTGVTYNTDGYGKADPAFGNTLPEERFYNRTVTIDIIPSSVGLNK
jgi:outer membrane protein OmpA-like peptidoglycan-associated protein